MALREEWVPIEVADLYSKIKKLSERKEELLDETKCVYVEVNGVREWSFHSKGSDEDKEYKEIVEELKKLYVFEEQIRYACVDFQRHKA